MQYLIKQEQFELEVLDRLNSARFLNYLVFVGGTMLRLCFGLNRFSADLDFWIIRKIDIENFFERLKKYLLSFYTIKDSANKFYTLLFEIKSKNYPRALKIEIRKWEKSIQPEEAIAYSRYSNTQVLLKVVCLKDMLKAKIESFLERKEIRDVFDIEFLIKKGVELDINPKLLKDLIKQIDALSKKDYTVKLGSILEPKDRKFYKTRNFEILKMFLNELSERFNGAHSF